MNVLQRWYGLPLLALVGLGITLMTLLNDSSGVPSASHTPEPATSPYPNFVAGTGLVEASTGNIAIGSPVSGIARKIDVQVGDQVRAGDPLFQVDDRDLRAQLVSALAKVKVARAALQRPTHRLQYVENLKQQDPQSVSAQDLSEPRDELALAEANLGYAEAEVERLRLELERRFVRAPIAGRVLQLKLRLGEYVDSMSPMPVMLLGDDSRLYVRVEIDENDAWQVRRDASAVAFLRGKPDLLIPLQFQYIEPAVIAKTSLLTRRLSRHPAYLVARH